MGFGFDHQHAFFRRTRDDQIQFDSTSWFGGRVLRM